jgi:hypothetical protein
MAQANAGDIRQAKQALNAILQNPEAKALLQQLGREKHE